MVWMLVSVPSPAHHGLGTIDATRDLVISGTITGVDFINPHSWLYLDVRSDEGARVTYKCEMRPAAALNRAGWTAEMFVVGEAITVEASPDRQDPNRCYVATLVFQDGNRLDRYGGWQETSSPAATDRPPRLPGGEPNISGTWAAEPWVMTDPRGQRGAWAPRSLADTVSPGGLPIGTRPMAGVRGQLLQGTIAFLRTAVGAGSFGLTPPSFDLTAHGTEALREYRQTTDVTQRFCETVMIVRDWGTLVEWSPVNRITQSEDTITLEYGHLGTTRTIHMNMDAHPPDVEPSRIGHSIGYWEDDVLVVDTTGFSPGWMHYAAVHGERLHLVERFVLDSETMELTREWTVEDPEYLVGEGRGSDTVYAVDTPYLVPPCEEG
jgi:hypothetical protein